MQKLSLFAFLLMLTASPPLAAQTNAQSNNATHSMGVSYSDLDLRNDKHVRKLERRIARAAQSLCGEASNLDLAGMNDARACRREARLTAQPQAAQLIAASRGTAPVQLSARD